MEEYITLVGNQYSLNSTLQGGRQGEGRGKRGFITGECIEISPKNVKRGIHYIIKIAVYLQKYMFFVFDCLV